MQVYRVLHVLIEKGVIHRLETLSAYVPCGQPDGRGHGLTVLAICIACGRLMEFVDEEATCRLNAWSMRRGFQLTSSIIEIRGVCLSCKNEYTPEDEGD